MPPNRRPLGMLIAAVGAAAVALATFQPWYMITVTPAGLATAQQQLNSIGEQYGSMALQSIASEVGARVVSLTGQPIATVSAHDSLKRIGTVLLMLGLVALAAAILRLAGVIGAGGALVTLCGVVALGCVLYRMFDPPHPDYISISLAWGSWLALGGAVACVIGGFLSPRVLT